MIVGPCLSAEWGYLQPAGVHSVGLTPFPHCLSVSNDCQGQTALPSAPNVTQWAVFDSLVILHLGPLLQPPLYAHYWAVNRKCSGLWNGNWNLSREQISPVLQDYAVLKTQATHSSGNYRGVAVVLCVLKLSYVNKYYHDVTVLLWVLWLLEKEHWGKETKNNETSLSSQDVSISVKKINAIYMVPENAWQCIIKCQKIVACCVHLKKSRGRKKQGGIGYWEGFCELVRVPSRPWKKNGIWYAKIVWEQTTHLLSLWFYGKHFLYLPLIYPPHSCL